MASFTLCWFFLQRGGFLHSADAEGLNDIAERWFCLPTQVVFAAFPGTAHRPFPTVSLVGGSVHPTGSMRYATSPLPGLDGGNSSTNKNL